MIFQELALDVDEKDSETSNLVLFDAKESWSWWLALFVRNYMTIQN